MQVGWGCGSQNRQGRTIAIDTYCSRLRISVPSDKTPLQRCHRRLVSLPGRTSLLSSMSHRSFSRHSLESCTLKFDRWKPFFLSSSSPKPTPLAADLSSSRNPIPTLPTKRQCLTERPTNPSLPISSHAEFLEISNPSLIEENDPNQKTKKMAISFRHPWKRRRPQSKSASGRSSDRSRAAVAAASASDFPIWAGTDSSGELFFNCDTSWISDDAKASGRKDAKELGGGENFCASSCSLQGAVDLHTNESGYVSEPGYGGDVEYGYGDEIDEEEDDSRVPFWGDSGSGNMEIEEVLLHTDDVQVNAFSEQKSHYKCRRKKHDCRMAVS